jgi:hypothetical protein
MENTNEPFLARQLKLERDILQDTDVLPKLKQIDSYILSLVKERQWVDNEASYQDILKEISKSLGLDEHLDVFARIDKLLMGTKLLKEQRFHERLAKALKANIQNLNTKL